MHNAMSAIAESIFEINFRGIYLNPYIRKEELPQRRPPQSEIADQLLFALADLPGRSDAMRQRSTCGTDAASPF